jgi:DNA repair protein RadC
MAYTRALARVADALDLVLADHLIVAGAEVTSLRDAGLI